MGLEKFGACSLNDFVLAEELFRGNAGSVWKAQFKYDKQWYVLKQHKLTEKRSHKSALNEVSLLLQLNHPNCIKCYGHFVEVRDNSVYIVLDYCGCGDLGKFIESKRSTNEYLPEEAVWYIFHSICLGVQHMHRMGIVHRDIKAMNILLCQDGRTVKVADLGVSRQMSEDTVLLQTFSGTPLYISPELVDGAQYTEKTDIWSLGVLLYELCALEPPFRGSSLSGLVDAIRRCHIGPLPSIYSGSMDRCVRWMLAKDYHARPNINQVVERVATHLSSDFREPLWGPTVGPLHDSKEEPRLARKCESFQDDSELQREQIEKCQDVSTRREPRVGRSVHDEYRQSEHEKAPCEQVVQPHDTIGWVLVDIQRLQVLERREKNILRKFLQTKTLASSDNDSLPPLSAHQSTRPHTANTSATTSSYSNLDEKIKKCQDILFVIQAALEQNGKMKPEDAVRCGISPLSNADGVKRSNPSVRHIEKQVHSAEGSVSGKKQSNVLELHYQDPYFDSTPSRKVFQQPTVDHALFSPSSQKSHPQQPTSRPSTTPAAPMKPPGCKNEGEASDWFHKSSPKSRDFRIGVEGRHRGGSSKGLDRSGEGKGKYNLISGKWEPA
mmetsp:Transcript_14676/g.22145  ORF Transcript_14676/g.22145 Transcript_14676/m.22145 type:complete len:609 (+) Transcript_14676:119-1945(+)